MIPPPEMSMLLRRWAQEKRRLQVIASLGGIEFTAICRVKSASETFFTLTIGAHADNLIGFSFEGWAFEYADATSDHNEFISIGNFETAICGGRKGSTLRIYLLAKS